MRGKVGKENGLDPEGPWHMLRNFVGKGGGGGRRVEGTSNRSNMLI